MHWEPCGRSIGRVAYFKGKIHVLIYSFVRSVSPQQGACEGFLEEVGVDLSGSGTTTPKEEHGREWGTGKAAGQGRVEVM